MSWSSGKDSAWSLHKLLHDPVIEVVGLFSTVSEEDDRIPLHGTRTEMLQAQALSLGLPLDIIRLPGQCSNTEYEKRMGAFVEKAAADGVELFGFGDLALEDVRRYREKTLRGTGIEGVFPIWGRATDELAYEMIDGGLKAVVTCVDERVPGIFIGKEYSEVFLDALPLSIDPCGENGEFHTFVFDGPMFRNKLELEVGETVQRDCFIVADVSLRTT